VIPIPNKENIEFLIGDGDFSVKSLTPFSETCCQFLNEVSSILLADKSAKDFPDVVSFAFWCRKANLKKAADNYTDKNHRLGIGRILHIAPSNVPVNFAFSLVFGLLAGNSNIVRVPTKTYPQVSIICKAINEAFRNEQYLSIAPLISIIRYDHSDSTTESLSSFCDGRIIWGGDETVKNVRALPTPVRCVDIAFADRYSFCVMNPHSIAVLSDIRLAKLVEGFYNDTYLMDQNACSSPHLVVWTGDHNEQAKSRFWKALASLVQLKYSLEPIHAIDKYTLLCRNSIDLENISSFEKFENYLYRIKIDSLPENIDSFRGKCGYFLSMMLLISPKQQTSLIKSTRH
jgi:hypothetical protein